LCLIALVSSCCRPPPAELLDPPFCALQRAQEEALITDPLLAEADWVEEEWWNLFCDEQLATFIALAFERNPTLQAVEANIALAFTNANRMRASLFPYIFWGGDVGRQKLSETGIIPLGNNTSVPIPASSVIPIYFTQYESQINLNYNFDLWGKNRNAFRAALGEAQAKIADRAFARLQLGIAVADLYFQLQVLYQREEVYRSLVDNRTEYLALVKKQLQDNVEDIRAVNTAEANLADIKATLFHIEGEIAVNEHQLKSYLAGDFMEEVYPICIDRKVLPKVPIPANLPLRLIAHRPDIIAQLWLIESAGKQIDVARAGFYPDFNLTSFFGFQTIHFQELLRWPSSYFNVDPAFTLPIFDGGRLLANLESSEVNYDLAIYKYNELVLQAAREVLDGFTVLRSQEEQLKAYDTKRAFEEKNCSLVRLRVAHNMDSHLDYLSCRETFLLAQDGELTSLAGTYHALLLLIKSLGGGYEA